jgi:hypothetical protein
MHNKKAGIGEYKYKFTRLCQKQRQRHTHFTLSLTTKAVQYVFELLQRPS